MKPYKLVLSKYPRIALKIVRASTPEIKHAPIKVAQEITKAMKSLLINELYYCSKFTLFCLKSTQILHAKYKMFPAAHVVTNNFDTNHTQPNVLFQTAH